MRNRTIIILMLGLSLGLVSCKHYDVTEVKNVAVNATSDQAMAKGVTRYERLIESAVQGLALTYPEQSFCHKIEQSFDDYSSKKRAGLTRLQAIEGCGGENAELEGCKEPSYATELDETLFGDLGAPESVDPNEPDIFQDEQIKSVSRHMLELVYLHAYSSEQARQLTQKCKVLRLDQ